MRKLLFILLVCAAALLPGRAHATAPAWAGSCGLPGAAPLWVDYGWPELGETFGRPGEILTATGKPFADQMRAVGVPTVFFDLYLKNRVGQPATPADPSAVVARANKLYEYAVAQIGCETPTIVENELFGAHLVTPWSETNTQYRQNVLTYLQTLKSRGAHPVLLVNSKPYTAGDVAAGWWQQVAAVADIVRETYVPATLTWKAGSVLGSRKLRSFYRSSIADLTALSIPPERLGIMISFATGSGGGGRAGLEPATSWFQVAKWQALAAKTVADETGIGSVWSWGWAGWTPSLHDVDKPLAGCVWLWARNPSLCDAPGEIGPDFDASLTDGQIRLPAGVQCTAGKTPIPSTAIAKLQRLTGDRDTAFTALYQRIVESRYAPVSARTVLDAEQAVIATEFNGSRGAYVAALAKAGADVQVARGVLGDELRRQALAAKLPARTPSATEVKTFYSSYPDLLVRAVETKKVSALLNGAKRGLLLQATAPEQLFTGGIQSVWTPLGRIKVKPLATATPLGTVPLEQARPAIVAALRTFARGEAFGRWTERKQADSLVGTTCLHDDLPQPGAVELSTYLPFLQLT